MPIRRERGGPSPWSASPPKNSDAPRVAPSCEYLSSRDHHRLLCWVRHVAFIGAAETRLEVAVDVRPPARATQRSQLNDGRMTPLSATAAITKFLRRPAWSGHASRPTRHGVSCTPTLRRALVVATLLLGGCASSRKPLATPPTGPAPPPLSLSPDPRIATTTTLLLRPALPTPEAATKELWDAWRDNDRPRALHFHPVKVVDVLLATKWSPQTENLGCDHVESANPVAVLMIACHWRTPDGGFTITVVGRPNTGYRVTRLDIGIPATTVVTPASGADATVDSIVDTTEATSGLDSPIDGATTTIVRRKRTATSRRSSRLKTTTTASSPVPGTRKPQLPRRSPSTEPARVEVQTRPVESVASP